MACSAGSSSVFNRAFRAGSKGYANGVTGILGRKSAALLLYAVPPRRGLCLLQPRSARLRADAGQAISGELRAIAGRRDPRPHGSDHPANVRHRAQGAGVESAVAFPGLSINGFINSPSAGVVFVTLKPFAERKSKALSGFAIAPKAARENSARCRMRSSPSFRRRRFKAWGRSAASSCKSKTGPTRATTPSTR